MVTTHIVIFIEFSVVDQVINPKAAAFGDDRTEKSVSGGDFGIDGPDYLEFTVAQVFQLAFPVWEPGNQHGVARTEVVAPDTAFAPDHFGFDTFFFS